MKPRAWDRKNKYMFYFDDLHTDGEYGYLIFEPINEIRDKCNGEVDKVILTGDAKIIQTKVTVTGHRITLNPETEVLTSEGGAYTAANMDGSIVHIWANFQEFDNKAGAMMGVGKVKIRYKSYLATGPKAVMVPDKKGEKPNRVIFNGRSTITEDNKSIQADHIEITMNPKNFTAEGNVKTRLRNLSSMDNKGRGR